MRKILRNSEFKASMFAVLAFNFLMFIYAPLETYCYNIDEFWYDIYLMFPIVFVLFLCAEIVCTLMCLLIHKVFPKIFRVVVLPAIMIVFLCTYVQGTFLVANLPHMDGRPAEWINYNKELVISILLWVVVITLVVVAYRALKGEKFAKLAQGLSICMTLMLLLSAGTILLTSGALEKKMDACATTKDINVYSEDKNYVILILDSVDAATLTAVMNEDPSYQEIFRDFTYYANVMGAYPCTDLAVPHILSGVWYENEIPKMDYIVDSYNQSPLLERLEKEGYALGMYEYEMPYEDEKVFRFHNVVGDAGIFESNFVFAKLQFKMAAYRYAPVFLKDACIFDPDRFGELWKNNTEYEVFVPDNKIVYDSLRRTPIRTVADKQFKLIHVEGAHVPFQYDRNMNPVANGTYEESVRSSLLVAKELIDQMKAADVYENSVIVVMADHGFAPEYGFVEDVKACEGRQNPILLAKGLGETHAKMSVSQAPASYVDLQVAFERLGEEKSSAEIFDVKEGQVRERRYLYYEFLLDKQMTEYKSTGHASDRSQMIKTGKEYIR